MALITYEDKVALNENSSIPNINKVTAGDMNQIKNGVNTNETNIGTLQTDFTNATAYSTTETVVGVYSGKPVYRKVIRNNSGATLNDFNIIGDLMNMNTLLRFNSYAYTGDLYYVKNFDIDLYIDASAKNVVERHSDAWWSNRPITIIAEYTKTTD